MGLYLAVFQDDVSDEELDGVDVGPYEGFSQFRQAVSRELEHEVWGSRFPILMNHPDSDGIWSPEEARQLERELLEIASNFAKTPASADGATARSHGRQIGPFLSDLFVDADGNRLIDRMIVLAKLAVAVRRPIHFQ